MSRRLRSLVIAGGVLALLFPAGLLMRLAVSEGRDVDPGSIAAWLLIPPELTDERLTSIGSVERFRYSAADGPKPAVAVAFIAVQGEEDEVRDRIEAYFRTIGFEPDADGALRRDSQEVALTFDQEPPGRRVEVALLDYLE